MEGSGDVPDASSNSTPTVEMVEEEPLNGNFIETVSFCKNIRNVQVLTEAIRGFQGMPTLIQALLRLLICYSTFRTPDQLFRFGRLQTTSFPK